MECKVCGHKNPTEARFCGYCGAALATTEEALEPAVIRRQPEPMLERPRFWIKHPWLMAPVFAAVAVVVVVVAPLINPSVPSLLHPSSVRHYDGSTWSEMYGSTSDYLYDVWGSSASNVFVVGTAYVAP